MSYVIEEMDPSSLKYLSPELAITVIMDRDITECYHPSIYGRWFGGEDLIESYGDFLKETMRRRGLAEEEYLKERKRLNANRK